MGWYIKTHQQLMDSGWEKPYSVYIKKNNNSIVPAMTEYLGQPWEGPEPDYSECGVHWEGWGWSRDMLIWIPE